MKLLKSALVAGSWFLLSSVYAQSGPVNVTAANPQAAQQPRTIGTDTASTAVREAPQVPRLARKTDKCVGPASYCSIFFGGS